MEQQIKTNEDNISTKGFFLLIGSVIAGAIALGAIVHWKTLEEAFVYKEDNRIHATKDLLFKTECKEPREKQELLVHDLEEREGIAALRMTEAYQNGWKDHPTYKSGAKIIQGEAYVKQRCDAAIKTVSTLKRNDSTEYVLTHFFGGR
jgi:hypothetical protein